MNGIILHSYVEEITNSSTVIYTYIKENGIDTLKQFINDMLSDAGSEKTADDLYEFELALGDNAHEMLTNICYGDSDCQNYDHAMKKAKAIMDLMTAQEIYDKYYKDSYYELATEIKVTRKSDGKNMDFTSILKNIVASEELCN